eukprot:TRINITY_DN1761_c0_g1_i3.p1 TRINITY_DN1761_c0_g1~~TRINITY_DN1761_c0_g1_i3.p1  ORF type:complete len:251 (+),score=48.02 TRINITY_DN1761_c0_g1_i3:157-909(+)
MTMLIAGHETTAAVLTWAAFLLSQHPEAVEKAREEIDRVLGDRQPGLEDIKKLQFVRLIVAETLRLFPQPPLLIRRSLGSDTLPGGQQGPAEGYPIPSGTDIFISVYNLHRSPSLWDAADDFDPTRFLRPKAGPSPDASNPAGVWEGFDPERGGQTLYPNEVISDFAFLPFGGGLRKCVGDQFALLESTVALVGLLRRFDVRLAGTPEDVQLVTGATIHTKDGLWCRVSERQREGAARGIVERREGVVVA